MHYFRQVIADGDLDKQMEMIGYQAVMEYVKYILLFMLTNEALECRIIAGFSEQPVLVMPPLDDMVHSAIAQ
jgi:hypothetical protein